MRFAVSAEQKVPVITCKLRGVEASLAKAYRERRHGWSLQLGQPSRRMTTLWPYSATSRIGRGPTACAV